MQRQATTSERIRARLDQIHWKSIAKTIVNRMGYSVARIDPIDRSDASREDPFHDQRRILTFAGAGSKPTIFDVGANVGMTAEKYRTIFPDAAIHSFEPLPKAFAQLITTTAATHNIIANQLALHATPGRKTFLSNRGGANQTSSFLPPAETVGHSYPSHAFELESRIDVETETLDRYCESRSIDHVHILKMDTQGTELDILRGSKAMLGRRAITMAYVEVLFTHLYDGDALYHQIASFLEDCGMDLFRIYFLNHGAGGRHIGGDALFVERSLLRSFLDSITSQSARE